MGVKCIIKFDDNEKEVYYGGQTLKGTVELTLGSAQKFRALRLTVNGDAQCKWSEKVKDLHRNSCFFLSSRSRRNRAWTYVVRVKFQGKEIYLNSEHYLFGSDIGESIEYAAGVHCFNFACLLPPGLPSSIEGSYGHIRYNVEAVLDIPWALDKDFKAPFTVVRVENLNSWPHLQVPRETHIRKNFCSLSLACCSGFMLIQATIPVAGFIPGETIPVELEIKNTTGISVAYTKLAFQRITEYLSTSPYRRSKWDKDQKLNSVKGPGFNSHSTGKVLSSIIVPAFTSSNGHCSGIIKVSYSLEITCKVRGFHFSPRLSIPITIGNVPFAANSLLYDAAIFAASAPTAPMDDLPPSFEAATSKPQYDKSIEAGQSQGQNPAWNSSLNSSNAPSAPEF